MEISLKFADDGLNPNVTYVRPYHAQFIDVSILEYGPFMTPNRYHPYTF